MRKKLLKFSACQAIIGAFVFLIDYLFFHFVTDNGISFTWQPEAGKPFVADLIGIFGTLFLFGAVVSLLAAFIFFDKKESEENQ
ncbi:MAG: hypothetical protein IJC99_05165 [Clostridia bacterium]|nr:hypothetical protein [Clostridia bacterium]